MSLNMKTFMQRSNLKWFVLLVLFVILFIFAGIVVALFITALIAALILNIDNRGPLVLALVLLIACPFFLLLGIPSTANAFADLSFYLLAIGVALQLSSYMRSGVETQEMNPSDWK